MACLANNRRMQELARKFAAELSFDFGGVVGEVEAARPTPLSVLRELVADNCGFATAVLDVQSRLLKARYTRPKTRVNHWRGLPPILLSLFGYEGAAAMGAVGVVHAAEIRVLGPTAIEDYHAHLMRLDRTSAFPATIAPSTPIASTWWRPARS